MLAKQTGGTPVTPELLSQISELGFQPATIIDLGAAEGTWTREARSVFPTSTILMCEPLPQREKILSAVAAKSGGKTIYSPVVVGPSDGFVSFNVTDDFDGSGVYGSDNCVKLKQNTLDNLVEEHRLTGPFVIKFDTHGFEMPILEGARKTLDFTDIIIMECYLHKISPTALVFWEMCEHLSKIGFRPFQLIDIMQRPIDSTLWQFDLAFARSEHNIFSCSKYT